MGELGQVLLVPDSYPFAAELEKLDVLASKDQMLKYWVRQFQITLIRIRKQTVNWAVGNLVDDSAAVNILAFSLPMSGMLLRDFRIFYVQAYQLGAGDRSGNRLPVGGLRLRADMATMVFIIRIERDIKDEWRRLRTHKKSIIAKVTSEVFERVIY